MNETKSAYFWFLYLMCVLVMLLAILVHNVQARTCYILDTNEIHEIVYYCDDGNVYLQNGYVAFDFDWLINEMNSYNPARVNNAKVWVGRITKAVYE